MRRGHTYCRRWPKKATVSGQCGRNRIAAGVGSIGSIRLVAHPDRIVKGRAAGNPTDLVTGLALWVCCEGKRCFWNTSGTL